MTSRWRIPPRTDSATTRPRRYESGRAGVDWCRAGHDLVAVHLTAAGVARVQNYRFETGNGPAVLSGWDAETTARLRLPSSARLTTEPGRA